MTLHRSWIFLALLLCVSAMLHPRLHQPHGGHFPLSTLPPGESVAKGTSTAEVQIHPSGQFLYGSNRGHNTIVAYAIDATSGKLTLIDHHSTLGKTPRHFALDPTGTWLLAENQDSSTVAVFRIDPKSGRLTPTGPLLEVPKPVCAVFVPVPS